MTQIFDGVTMAQCFQVVSSAWKEINTLTGTLDNLLSPVLAQNDLPYKLIGKSTSAVNWDDYECVRTDLATNFPLARKRKGPSPKQADKYFGYQISLLGSGINGSNKPEPLLHVFLWNSPVDFDNAMMWFPFSEHDLCRVENQSLIVWPHEDARHNEWTFSLRLTSLNSSESLEQQIVRPAMALLGGESAQDALPDTLPGLVRYRKGDDGHLIILDK